MKFGPSPIWAKRAFPKGSTAYYKTRPQYKPIRSMTHPLTPMLVLNNLTGLRTYAYTCTVVIAYSDVMQPMFLDPSLTYPDCLHPLLYVCWFALSLVL